MNLKHKNILFIFFTLFTFFANAQKKQNAALANIAKVNLFNPGVSFEKKINSNQTLYINAFYNPSIVLTNNGFLSNTAKLIFEPSASIQYRFYYNIPVRANKMNMLNSYNYVCPVFETNFSKRNILLFNAVNNSYAPINKIGALWGMQRNYSSRFSLDFNIGLAYLSYKTTNESVTGIRSITQVSTIRPMGHLNLGFYIGKKGK